MIYKFNCYIWTNDLCVKLLDWQGVLCLNSGFFWYFDWSFEQVYMPNSLFLLKNGGEKVNLFHNLVIFLGTLFQFFVAWFCHFWAFPICHVQICVYKHVWLIIIVIAMSFIIIVFLQTQYFLFLSWVTSGDGSIILDESPKLKHEGAGLLSMPVADRDTLGSHFIITFAANHNLDRSVFLIAMIKST